MVGSMFLLGNSFPSPQKPCASVVSRECASPQEVHATGRLHAPAPSVEAWNTLSVGKKARGLVCLELRRRDASGP